MKKIFTLLLFSALVMSAFAQTPNIVLYGLMNTPPTNPNDPTSVNFNMVEVDPYTMNPTTLFLIDSSNSVASGASCYDQVQKRYLFWGYDIASQSRAYNLDLFNLTVQNSPALTTAPIELEFDLQNGNTYGLVWDNTTQTEYFVQFDIITGVTTNIAAIPGLVGILVGSSSYDSNNHRFIFEGLDNASVRRLYTIDALTGSVVYNPPITNQNYTFTQFYQYDNKKNKLYGLENKRDTTVVDPLWGYLYENRYIEIDPATANYTVLNSTPVLAGFLAGFALGGITYDQSSSTYIMHTVTDTGRVLMMVDSSGNVFSKAKINKAPYEIHCDNFGFILKYYSSTNPIFKNSKPLSVFPNPAIDYIQIDATEFTNGEGILRITNLSGQTVYNENLNINSNNIEISVDNLPKGNYIITLLKDEVMYKSKFLKI